MIVFPINVGLNGSSKYNRYAKSFINAIERDASPTLLTTKEKTDINTLIVALLEINALDPLYFRPDNPAISKRIWLYPYINSTATAHKYNLVNPLDTDAAGRLIFTDITHSDGKITPDNASTSSAYASLNANDHITANDHGFLSFIDSDDFSGSTEFGIYTSSTSQLRLRCTGTTMTAFSCGTLSIAYTTNTAKGLWHLNRTAVNNGKLYKNGAQVATSSVSNTGILPTTRVSFLGAPQSLTGTLKASIFGGGGLSVSAEVLAEENRVIQNFCEAQGRLFFLNNILYWVDENEEYLLDENNKYISI